MKHITPCLWFDDNAEEAVGFYLSVFKDKLTITATTRYTGAVATMAGKPDGAVLTVLFEINGQEYMALNGGPMFKFTEAISLMVMCEDQKEVDYYWNALSGVGGGPGSGGQPGQCGWLKDKYGVSWQIVPVAFMEMMKTKDARKWEAAMSAMLPMTKMDIATLKKAYDAA